MPRLQRMAEPLTDGEILWMVVLTTPFDQEAVSHLRVADTGVWLPRCEADEVIQRVNTGANELRAYEAILRRERREYKRNRTASSVEIWHVRKAERESRQIRHNDRQALLRT